MRIREAQETDLEAWAALRHALWPEGSLKGALAGARAILADDDMVGFLLLGPDDSPGGFVEADVHLSPNGPYAHIEGWYVAPEFRGKGYGRALIQTVEGWCLHRTICLLTSDTEADYPLSPGAHLHAGFRKMCDLMIFMKEVQRPPEPDE